MNLPQPSFTVRVDPTNPGQFFACGGLLEVAHRLFTTANVEGWFSEATFNVSIAGRGPEAFQEIWQALRGTDLVASETRGDPATYPVSLSALALTLDWWLDGRSAKTPFKLWAGQQTALRIVTDLQRALPPVAEEDIRSLFYTAKPLTGRFGVDPRAAWNALDVGFSPNEQAMEVATFPAVELLAGLGLQRFVPRGEGKGRESAYLYYTWSVPLPITVASAVCAGVAPCPNRQCYAFAILDRGSYKGFSNAVFKEGNDD